MDADKNNALTMRKSLCVLGLATAICITVSAQNSIHSIGELNSGRGPWDASELNSHVADISRSTLEPDFRTFRTLSEKELGQQMLDYGRIKRLQDGTYVLFYQSLRVGYHIYVSFSRDLLEWTPGLRVFEGREFINPEGEKDHWKYATADAVQLKNGDILVFCIFHANNHYGRHLDQFGVCFKRSSDGGHTWSEEQVLYNTVNWEPYPMVLDDGEILVFFTDSDWDWNPNSSGTSILRSKDDGKTWTLQKQAIRQRRATARVNQRSVGTPRLNPDSTRTVFTDQMPVVCKLNCGNRSLAVLESSDAEKNLTISMAWEEEHWPVTLTGEMTGPKLRRNNNFAGSGPYVMQFPSGETAVTYTNGEGHFACRLGNETGWDIPEREEFTPFGGKIGRWGSVTLADSHTAVAVVTHPYKGVNVEKGHLLVTQMRLNHRVDAPALTPQMDGKSQEWDSVSDALFLGSDTPAQCSMRFAHDDSRLYILVECLDSEISAGDGLTLLLGNGSDDKGLYKIFLDASPKKISIHPAPTLKSAAAVSKGEGYTAEFSIEKSALPLDGDYLYVNAMLYKGDTCDCFTNVPTFGYDRWLPVKLK